MYQSSFDLFDRLSAKSSFKPITSSIFGMLASFALVGIMLWLFIPTINSFFAGIYYQSMFQVQKTPYYTMNIPHDLRTAIIFYNKTNNQIANHTQLLQNMNVQAYQSSASGTLLKSSNIQSCDPNYFANTINPITLTDCFIFPTNSQIDISYYAATGATTFGFSTSLLCSDPFNCYNGKTIFTNAQNTFSSLFTNYSYSLYFTSRVIMPDSTFKEQLFSIYSSQFNTPFTITSDSITQLQTLNTTLDSSILTWTNTKTYIAPAWYGVVGSNPKNNTAVYSSTPKAGFTNSKYQNIAYRYYKKADWLVGMIGGTMFLLFIILYIPFHYINESLSHMHQAQQMFIQHPSNLSGTISVNDLKPVKVPWYYCLQRLIPRIFYQNKQIKEVKRVFDIANIIKMLKVIQRNLNKHGVPQYLKKRVLKIQTEEQQQNPQVNRSLQDDSMAIVNEQVHQQIHLEEQVPQRRQEQSQKNKNRRYKDRMKQQKKQENNQQKQEQKQKIQQPQQQIRQSRQVFDYSLNKSSDNSKILGRTTNYIHLNQKIDDKHLETFQLSPLKSKPKQEQAPEENQTHQPNIIDIGQNQTNLEDKKQTHNQTYQYQIPYQNIFKPQIHQLQQHQQNQLVNQNQIQPQESNNIILITSPRPIVAQQTPQQQCSTLNIHHQVHQLILKQQKITQFLGVNSTNLALLKRYYQYQQAMRLQENDRLPNTTEYTKIKTVLNQVVQCLRSFDIFGVKPQFSLSPADSSVFGCLVGLFIASISILFFISTLLQADNIQVFVSNDFQTPQNVRYNLTTGPGFRPFVCGSSSAINKILSSTPNVTLSFFSNTPNGRETIPMFNLQQNQHSYLGISTDSQYYSSITTKNCFVMKDNHSIAMGGFGTSHEAYFGFRLDPYCSGTATYCQSISATLKTNFFSFINSFGLTLYLPANSYDENTNSISSGGTYSQAIRQGTTSFTTYSAVQQTMYVDQIRLLDRYRQRFVGKSPPVLQQFITSGRYQPEPRVEGLVVSLPYYQVRIRPSGKVINVYLNGYTSDLLLAIIGGISLIFYALFHCIAKNYNHFNVRAKLLQGCYEQQLFLRNFFYKLIIMIPIPTCLFTKRYRDQIIKDRKLDHFMKQELNQIQLVKQISTMYHLSTGQFKSNAQKQLSLIYIKPCGNNPEQTAANNTPNESQYLDQDGQTAFEIFSNSSINQIINQNQNISRIEHRNEQQQSQPQLQFRDRQLQQMRQMVRRQQQNWDPIKPYNIHKGPQTHNSSNFLQYLDLFSCKPQFSLQGKWRVQSVFGSLVFFSLIVFIYLMGSYQLDIYVKNENQTINYQKTMIPDVAKQPGLVLNSTNYRFALGFYVKPNATFLDVSSLVNTTSNVIITVNQITVIRNRITGLITQTEVVNLMVPCTSDYFKGFEDNNTDYSFLSSVKNAWCIPKNLTLNITPTSSSTVTQYVTFKVTTKTSDTTTLNNLKTLTGNYVIGILMTVPVIDLANKQFRYSVQQIRGFLNPATRTMSYNITLTKQQITFTTPKYTLNPPQTTLTTYNYLDNKNNEFVYSSASNTSLPRNYNISLSYEGLLEQHTVQNQHIVEVLGIIGGLIVVYYFVSIFIVESFNKYKMRFLVGQELYLIPSRSIRGGQAVQCNQFQLFACWLFSKVSCIFDKCINNTLYKKITRLQTYADDDLNINQFYLVNRNLKDRINNYYKWKNFPEVESTSLFTKLPYRSTSSVHYELQPGQRQFQLKHSLSSYQHQVIRIAIKQKVRFQDVFNDPTITSNLFYRGLIQQQNQNLPNPVNINLQQQQGEIVQMEAPNPIENRQVQTNNIVSEGLPDPQRNINQTFEMLSGSSNNQQQFR